MSIPSHHDTDSTLHETAEACIDALDQAKDPQIGLLVSDRYRIQQRLGKGAMGVVYKAVQVVDEKPVAIKVLNTHLSSDPDAIKRFQQEAKVASSLLHPHIVRLYDVGMMPSGQPYIVMEFVEGRTLSDVIREKRFFEIKEALPIITQVCEALMEAHNHGVLHRDIKPANIMLVKMLGQDNFVIVLDFSISKVIQRVSDVDTSTPGVLVGSPAYMSPERFGGSSGDFRADIYSVGIILFQLLAGRVPFKSAVLAKLMNDHMLAPPPRVHDLRPGFVIPESLQATINKALAKRPEDRHANVKQLLAELEETYRAISDTAYSAPPPAPQHLHHSTLNTPQGLPTIARPERNSLDSAPAVGAATSYKSKRTLISVEVPVTHNSHTAKVERPSVQTSRPTIRPPVTAATASKELLVLLAVAIVGLSTIAAKLFFLPSPTPGPERRTTGNPR